MKINGKYHIVDWKAFKRVCLHEDHDGYKFKMNEIISLGIIEFFLVAGFLIGAILTIMANAKENKALMEEVDKFRDLYFNEIDKWKNKYNNDDYEAY